MAATEPLIFDAIRTPRGRGKVNGSLHATKPIDLVVGLIHEMLSRNPDLDPDRIDDVVLGCVSPIGDQGADIAKAAAITAGLPDTVAGVQLNRFCASGPGGGQHRRAEGRAPAGRTSSWPAASSRCRACRWAPTAAPGRWTRRPPTTRRSSRRAIGADLIATIEGFSREDVDAYAARSQERAADAQAEGRFARSVVPVLDLNDQRRPRPRRVHPPGHHRRVARRAQARRSPRSARWAASTRSRCRSTTGSRRSTTSTRPATPRASSTAPRWSRSATSRSAPSWACAPRARIARHGRLRRRPDDHADRPGAGVARRRWPRPG